jgi:hypothetical protein
MYEYNAVSELCIAYSDDVEDDAKPNSFRIHYPIWFPGAERFKSLLHPEISFSTRKAGRRWDRRPHYVIRLAKLQELTQRS